eukprot:ctg_289.g177
MAGASERIASRVAGREEHRESVSWERSEGVASPGGRRIPLGALGAEVDRGAPPRRRRIGLLDECPFGSTLPICLVATPLHPRSSLSLSSHASTVASPSHSPRRVGGQPPRAAVHSGAIGRVGADHPWGTTGAPLGAATRPHGQGGHRGETDRRRHLAASPSALASHRVRLAAEARATDRRHRDIGAAAVTVRAYRGCTGGNIPGRMGGRAAGASAHPGDVAGAGEEPVRVSRARRRVPARCGATGQRRVAHAGATGAGARGGAGCCPNDGGV